MAIANVRPAGEEDKQKNRQSAGISNEGLLCFVFVLANTNDDNEGNF